MLGHGGSTNALSILQAVESGLRENVDLLRMQADLRDLRMANATLEARLKLKFEIWTFHSG